MRDRQQIVTRHFGESLFAGECLDLAKASTLIDIGSGAGFPALSLKVLAPHLQMTLIESQQKKVAFLREVVRELGMQHVSVLNARAEEQQIEADVVTLRAVEKFDNVLPVALKMIAAHGRVCLLIGSKQEQNARMLAPQISWEKPRTIPGSRERVVLVGGMA